MPRFLQIQVTSVKVEYDFHGGRTIKEFNDSTKARQFYSAKFKAGLNPKIVSASTNADK